MLTTKTIVFWLVVVLCATAVWRFLARRYFSAEAVEQKRRGRNHRRVVSRRHGPTVKLASKVPRK